MKTMIEVQYQEKNVKNGDLDKYVKETLKEQGVKTTEVETLNIYYLPETAKVFFVAIKKDGSELKGELDVNAMPEYPEVVKKTAAKKAVKTEKRIVKEETKYEKIKENIDRNNRVSKTQKNDVNKEKIEFERPKREIKSSDKTRNEKARKKTPQEIREEMLRKLDESKLK